MAVSVWSRFGFLAIAAIFHFVYIFSIFDIYFVSPIVHGMGLIPLERPADAQAPADRLVLFVGDGLRADKAFQAFPEPYPESEEDLQPRHLAPFLRSRVLEHGTFGVSHTRVPTESRPGHVALIAGLYEDVSAVTTGWKLNPVNFDSVFNRSRHTWSWGSPDILPMFETGAVPGRVDAYMYDAEFEDFTSDATQLDYWVFDHVKDFFEAAKSDESLAKALREDKIVFFLHLLGLDTSGHFNRPYSKEYLNNLKIVDKGVQEVYEMVQQFYNDDRTAYIFTADHGMSDWGSHGDGHPDNTRTPLIAWGSGVAPPAKFPDGKAPGHDEYSSDWALGNIRRNDVEQADVAALMAHLIGVEFPANSVGELPLPFLSATLEEKAQASLANARGILEMYRVKEQDKKSAELRYKPFSALSEAEKSGDSRIEAISELIQAGNYEEAIEESAALIKLTLQGLRYLQTYDWLFLRALVTVGYLGWMAFALTTVVDLHVLQGSAKSSRDTVSILVFSSALIALYASFIMSHSPISYYAYAFFPIVFWEEVYARRDSLVQGYRVLFGRIESGSATASLVFNSFVFVAIIQSLAVAYIHREVLTVLFIAGAFWPLAYGISFFQKHLLSNTIWFASCLIMSIFTLLPAMKVENISLIMAGGIPMIVVGVVYLVFEDYILNDFSRTSNEPKRPRNHASRALIGIQIGLVILAMLVTRSSALSLSAKAGLPFGNQVLGWVVLVASLLMPLAHQARPNNHYLHRQLVHFLTFAPTFIILTISYEGLFYVAFCVTLVSWVRLEHHIQSHVSQQTIPSQVEPTSKGIVKPHVSASQYRRLVLEDARVALFFFVFLQSAFFSTGNVASVSSFSLESVCRLVPIFDPFSQGALLILKLLIPFALISANLGVLNKRLGVAPSALLMVVMAIGDILTLYFFWVVRDEGSWLEIGSTISHFAIASLSCVFVSAMEGISSLLVAGMEVEKTLLEAPVVVDEQELKPVLK